MGTIAAEAALPVPGGKKKPRLAGLFRRREGKFQEVL
jgi:hypothetical protein